MTGGIFITGIGGFIGLRLAERLRERGCDVAGLDHSADAVKRARDRGFRADVADVSPENDLRPLLSGARTVIHTAAIVSEHGDMARFRRINVDGSRNVAEAARDVGARCFVQMSSVMVYGFDFPDQVAEDGPLRGEENPYCQTKIEAEQAVRELGNDRFGVILIRPGDVYGPGCVTWISRPLISLRKRQLVLPGHGSGKINHVYVDNLIDGILLAIEAEAYGEAFNITDGVAAKFRDFYGRLADTARFPRPFSAPTALTRILVRGVARLRAWGLTDNDASFETLRMLLRPNAYSIEKARRRLGYAPRVSLDQGFELTRPYIEHVASSLR